MIVRFYFEKEVLEVDAYNQLNILAHAQLLERSLRSRCGGHAECGTCRVTVRSGTVSKMQEKESALLALAKVNSSQKEFQQERLACQIFPESELVEIEVPTQAFKDLRTKIQLKGDSSR